MPTCPVFTDAQGNFFSVCEGDPGTFESFIFLTDENGNLLTDENGNLLVEV